MNASTAAGTFRSGQTSASGGTSQRMTLPTISISSLPSNSGRPARISHRVIPIAN